MNVWQSRHPDAGSAFNRIRDQEKRERLIELVQAVGDAEGEEEIVRLL